LWRRRWLQGRRRDRASSAGMPLFILIGKSAFGFD
jgi:hypothetical protein